MNIQKAFPMGSSSYEDLDVSIVNFSEFRTLPDYMLRKTKTEADRLIYIKEGRILYYVDDSSYILSSGDFVFTLEGTYCQAYHDNKGYLHCYIMELNCRFSKGHPLELPFPTVFNMSHNIVIDELYKNMSRIWRERSKGYGLMSRVIALQIFHELIFCTYHSGIREHRNNRIEVIKEYIYENCYREISVEEVADILNLNPNYLGSYFKKKVGYTLRQYVNCVRVNKAKSLLSTGKYSVSEVAEHCGYQDIHYFSKVFKEIEGVPPSAFIK